MTDRLAMFAACAPGLEALLAAELAELGIAVLRPVPGGIEFEGSLADCYRVNLGSGIASCVLVRVATFRCLRLAELRRKAANVDWPRWLDPAAACAVRARTKKSKLHHTGAIEQRVAEAIAEHGGAAGDGGVGVHVRFDHDVCTLSIDTSGEPLHRRGWRLATGKAPLREDLACAVLRASGWDRASPLVDPFAGSGTIAIEAAALARGLAPGRLRGFAFERLAGFDRVLWASVRGEVAAAARPTCPAPVFASDRDAGAVAAARANAERAGVAGDLTIVRAALSAAPVLGGTPPPGADGAVVCNPPHGRRIGTAPALRDLYAKLGDLTGALPEGWHLTIVAADRRLARRVGRPLRELFTVDHGGTRVHVVSSRGAGAVL